MATVRSDNLRLSAGRAPEACVYSPRMPTILRRPGLPTAASVRPPYGSTVDIATWIGLGTLVTAIIGLRFVGRQLREQQRTLRAELGNLYIERYWQIDDDLLLERKGSKRHRQHRHRYLRLFEDEFDVAKLGFLDPEQWRVWHGVLSDEGARELIRDDLRVCDPKGDSFRRLRACITQRERDAADHDVRHCEGNYAG